MASDLIDDYGGAKIKREVFTRYDKLLTDFSAKSNLGTLFRQQV